MLEGCGGRFHIEGMAHFQHLQEPVVFASNHMSALENVVMPGLILPYLDTTFVVKASLLTYPIFGPFVPSHRPHPAGKGQSPRRSAESAERWSGAHRTRPLDDNLSPVDPATKIAIQNHFNSLAVKLARKAGVRIVPVAVKTDFWGNGKYLRDFGPLRRDRPIHIKLWRPHHSDRQWPPGSQRGRRLHYLDLCRLVTGSWLILLLP